MFCVFCDYCVRQSLFLVNAGRTPGLPMPGSASAFNGVHVYTKHRNRASLDRDLICHGIRGPPPRGRKQAVWQAANWLWIVAKISSVLR